VLSSRIRKTKYRVRWRQVARAIMLDVTVMVTVDGFTVSCSASSGLCEPV
jgi:hypothetical protein